MKKFPKLNELRGKLYIGDKVWIMDPVDHRVLYQGKVDAVGWSEIHINVRGSIVVLDFNDPLEVKYQKDKS